ncbi:MAG: hypothetical protein WCJ61_01865 [Paludibacter sp.]
MLVKIASIGLIFLFSLVIIFHVLVLTGIINYNIIWGGRITNQSEMYVFEAISLSTNILFMFIVLLKTGLLKIKIPTKVINIGIWIMTILFTLNTVGNLVSTNNLEKAIFTPLTFISAILCLILALNKSKIENNYN